MPLQFPVHGFVLQALFQANLFEQSIFVDFAYSKKVLINCAHNFVVLFFGQQPILYSASVVSLTCTLCSLFNRIAAVEVSDTTEVKCLFFCVKTKIKTSTKR